MRFKIMKYIDTRSKESLKQGVMDFLNFTEDEMNKIFHFIYCDNEKEPQKWIEDFLSEYLDDETLEYIQIFHLSRRLEGTNLYENNNLKQLLLGDNAISRFLKKHNVTF